MSGKPFDHFSLAVYGDIAIAGIGGQDAFMPQILAPYLEGFRVFAEFFAKAYQHVPEGMRIKIRQPGGGEGILEYLPDRRGARPAFRLKTLRRKTLVFVMPLSALTGRMYIERGQRFFGELHTLSNSTPVGRKFINGKFFTCGALV